MVAEFQRNLAPQASECGQSVGGLSMLIDHEPAAINYDSSPMKARDVPLCVESLVYLGAVTGRGKMVGEDLAGTIQPGTLRVFEAAWR